jgi:hypothetical protein
VEFPKKTTQSKKNSPNLVALVKIWRSDFADKQKSKVQPQAFQAKKGGKTSLPKP